MNLNNTQEHNEPFKHWEISNCLDDKSLNEICLASIPEGDRSYDGTRAADHSGQGVDGKLRLFVSKENKDSFPYLTKIINDLQNKEFYNKISNIIEKIYQILM